MLQCVAVCCASRQFPLVQDDARCSMLQCGAECRIMLQGVAVCCSALRKSSVPSCAGSCVLQYVAVRCSMSQYVAVCCSMMQRVAESCSVLRKSSVPRCAGMR